MPIYPTQSRGPVDEDAEREKREKKGEKSLATAQYKGGQNAKEVRRAEEERQAAAAEAKKLARLQQGMKQMSVSPSRKERGEEHKAEKEEEEEKIGGELGEALDKFSFGKEG